MNFIRILFIACLISTVFYGTVFYFHQKQREHSTITDVRCDENGFISLSPPENAPRNKVLIIAPPVNCPSAAGRRADALEKSLLQAGIPYVRVNSASFSVFDQTEVIRRNQVMNSEPPIVFVGSRAKVNPNLSEITAEFRKLRER